MKTLISAIVSWTLICIILFYSCKKENNTATQEPVSNIGYARIINHYQMGQGINISDGFPVSEIRFNYQLTDTIISAKQGVYNYSLMHGNITGILVIFANDTTILNCY